MSAAMDNLRADVHKPPEQLEREADSARSALEGTLAELEQRLSPGELLDRVMDVVKRHGGEFGDNLLTQVRNNPLPTIIAGIGVAWLMSASKRPPPHGYRSYGRYDGDADIDATERWSSAAGMAGDGASSDGRSFGDRAADAADSLRSTAASTATSAKHAVEDAVDTTSRAAQRAAEMTRRATDRITATSRTSIDSISEGYSRLCREQPLVLGAIAVAAGAALGAMFRPTPIENRVLGEAGDAARSRLRSEAEARTGELRTAAEQALDTARDVARNAVKRDGADGSTGGNSGFRPDETSEQANASRDDSFGATPPG